MRIEKAEQSFRLEVPYRMLSTCFRSHTRDTQRQQEVGSHHHQHPH